MSPRNSITKSKPIGKVRDTKHLATDKLESFIKAFQLQVAKSNVSLKRLTGECCKSILYQCNLILNKVPKNGQDILMKKYFGDCESESLPSHSLPDQKTLNVIATPLPANIDKNTTSTARVLRSRSAKKTGSDESTKKLPKSKDSTKSSARKPLKSLNEQSNETSENTGKSVTNVSENVLVGISSNTGREVVLLNDNLPAVILPGNDSSEMIVIQPETSIANLKLDDTCLRDLKLLHKKIGQILKR
ncbi:hypothetical protein CHUAL_011760 [Chamberlinius hualienensis]